jgi:hypothetical protein
MQRALLHLLVTTMAVLVLPQAAAGNGGPSPGILVGGRGIPAAKAEERFVAVTGRAETVVQLIRMRTGQILRWNALPGLYGFPQVAFDGTTEGLTRDGRTLVLSSYTAGPGSREPTRFALIDSKRLRVRKTVELRGSYAFDALSPDGSLMYVTEYLSSPENPRYRVRVVDLERGKLLPGAVTDRRLDVGVMAGQPVTRAWSRDGVWAYTLYAKETGLPFVHALDTRLGRAFCIELPWRDAAQAAWRVRMRVDGGSLLLRQAGVGRLAEVDRKAFTVRTLARPQP